MKLNWILKCLGFEKKKDRNLFEIRSSQFPTNCSEPYAVLANVAVITGSCVNSWNQIREYQPSVFSFFLRMDKWNKRVYFYPRCNSAEVFATNSGNVQCTGTGDLSLDFWRDSWYESRDPPLLSKFDELTSASRPFAFRWGTPMQKSNSRQKTRNVTIWMRVHQFITTN